MKNIKVLSVSLLVAMFIAATAQMQGAVKAIDEFTKQVSGFLPYYLGPDGKTHALLGKYVDATAGDVFSAPVELAGYADINGDVNTIIAQYFVNPLKINKPDLQQPTFQVAKYQINGKDKNYYLWTIEVDQADVAGLIGSLKAKPNDPPVEIVDIIINDFYKQSFFGGIKFYLGKNQPLITPVMKDQPRQKIMDMARGFSDLFNQITENKTAVDKSFKTIAVAAPVTPASQDLKDKLTLLQAALDDLTFVLTPKTTNLP